MAKKISASVGKGGKNKPEDTKIVQELLNDFTKMCGFKKLDEDGLVGSKTISAIAEFQKTAVGMSKPDSRIDPNGDSFSTLSKGPKKAEAESKKAEEAEKEKQAAAEAKKAKTDKPPEEKESKPQVKGDTRSVDKKILALLEAISAHYGKPITVMESGGQNASVDGEQLWKEWLSKLDRGREHPVICGNNRLRDELDGFYNDVKKDKFLGACKNKLKASSMASSGGFNVKKNTDSKVVATLSSYFSRNEQGDVIHFDESGKSIPKTITEDMKKKWK